MRVPPARTLTRRCIALRTAGSAREGGTKRFLEGAARLYCRVSGKVGKAMNTGYVRNWKRFYKNPRWAGGTPPHDWEEERDLAR